jgi:hypothetical protein
LTIVAQAAKICLRDCHERYYLRPDIHGPEQ